MMRESALGAKQAAEKGLFPSEEYENIPQELKPAIYFQRLSARLKSCPDASCLCG
jgi:hypothetical protein